MNRTTMLVAGLLVGLVACNNGGGGTDSGSGDTGLADTGSSAVDTGTPATGLVGTWHRPGDSTTADVVLALTGSDTAGSFTVAAASANQNNDPPCTQHFRFMGTYVATATLLTFTAAATGATIDTMGCTDPANNRPSMGGPLIDMTAATQAMNASGTYTVSATQLVVTNMGTVTTFTRM